MSLKFKRRKLAVEKMRVGAVSWVEQGAVPGDNVVVIQGEGEETMDVSVLLQTYADRFASTDDQAQQMTALADLTCELGAAIVPVTQAANFLAELNESRARYPWDLWSAFTMALYDCDSPEDARTLVDQFAAQLKTELTAPGDGSGDEAPYQESAESGEGEPVEQQTNPGAAPTPEADVTAPVEQAASTTQEAPASNPAPAQSFDEQPATPVEQSTEAVTEASKTDAPAETAPVEQQKPGSIWDGMGANVPFVAKPVTQATGETSGDVAKYGIQQNADGTITVTAEMLKGLVAAAVKQGVAEATGRPRPVSQQGEESGRAPVVRQSSGSVWDGSPFDSLRA